MNHSSYSADVSKLATIPMARDRYKLSRNALVKYANEANAVVKLGKSIRINITKMDMYIDSVSGRS